MPLVRWRAMQNGDEGSVENEIGVRIAYSERPGLRLCIFWGVGMSAAVTIAAVVKGIQTSIKYAKQAIAAGRKAIAKNELKTGKDLDGDGVVGGVGNVRRGVQRAAGGQARAEGGPIELAGKDNGMDGVERDRRGAGQPQAVLPCGE